MNKVLMEGMDNALLDGQGAGFIFHREMTPI